MRRGLLLLLFLALPWSGMAGTTSVSVAAAANLTYVVEALNQDFQREHPDVRVVSTLGASGNLFAQIRHGAPFDVFLSADVDYPRALVRDGAGVASTLRTFAVGRLALWTTRGDLALPNPDTALRSPALRTLAIAQPRSAPYGRAAQAVLEHLGLWTSKQPRRVVGESIAQAAQFVETGNADAGLIALSFLQAPRLAGRGTWIEVPPELYAPVRLDHAGVLTRRGADNPAARLYLAFLASAPAVRILRQHGYEVPGGTAK